MTAIPVQVAFQGGGAKLIALMAAADALYRHENVEKTISVKRVAGTSAGAIAACMFATTKSPGEWRQLMLRLAPKHLPKIKKEITTRSFLWDAYFGNPLYNVEEYKEFIRKLFGINGDFNHLNHLQKPRIFYGTDIKNGKLKKFDGSIEEDTIETALFCSSALPFIFHTYKAQEGPVVDGGVINNFPSDDLLGFTDDGATIGFSFSALRGYNYTKDLKSYAKAIAFSAMDHAVDRSLLKLKKENTLMIKTSLSTLDFDEAIAALEDDEIYESYVAQAYSFIQKFVDKHTQQASPNDKLLNDKIVLENTIRSYHKLVSDNSKFNMKQKDVINYCYGLKNNDDGSNDFVTMKELIDPVDANITGYGFICKEPENGSDINRIQPSVSQVLVGTGNSEDVTDNYNVTSIRLPRSEKLKNTASNNVMFFFNPPLAKVEGILYEISYSYSSGFLLRDLLNRNAGTYIYGTRSSAVDTLNIIFIMPSNINLVLTEINKVDGDVLSEEYRLPQFSRWIKGEKLTASELRSYQPGPNFTVYGWRAEGVGVGEAVGIRLVPRG